MSAKVFLIAAHDGYEDCGHLVAFASREAADAFVAACAAYEKSRPTPPDSIEDDASWGKFQKREARWIKHHPSGESYPHHCYVVQELELRP